MEISVNRTDTNMDYPFQFLCFLKLHTKVIEDGDIICFQKSTPLGSEEECKYSNVPSFLVKKLEGPPNKKHKNCKLKLFLEVDFGPDQRPIPLPDKTIRLPDKTKEDILLFFKLYEPEKRTLGFVGRFFVKSLASQSRF
ncbi:hypothetical protein ACFX2B_045522 [Malus domestica]